MLSYIDVSAADGEGYGAKNTVMVVAKTKSTIGDIIQDNRGFTIL